LTVALLCSAAPTCASPITVTAGKFQVSWDDPNMFAFFGDSGFALGEVGVFASSAQNTCFRGCAPGTIVSLSATSTLDQGSFASTAFATIGGVSYPRPLALVGTLQFDAPSVELPPFDASVRAIHLSAPFVLAGRVSGFQEGTGLKLFDVDLDGRGIATLSMSSLESSRYTLPSLIYAFESPSPTPEPTTWALIAVGLAGLGCAEGSHAPRFGGDTPESRKVGEPRRNV
jgi:hypothetical protein